MDGFNPLDLLASAAELQQKHDDGPERIIITRQGRTSTKHTPLTNGTKENQGFISNNNNNVTRNKPSVVIVKKIKKNDFNPELEKMFDEHNYGNAKRTNNKGNDSAIEVNERKRKRTDSDSDNCYTSEQSVRSSITVGQTRDKITTVVANATQFDDSEYIHEGKCTVGCDKDTCLNRICMCKHETREGKYSNNDEGTNCECGNSEKQSGDHIGSNKGTSVGNRTQGTMIVKFNTSKPDRGSDISLDSSNLSLFSDDGLKLDEQTGELITKNGATVLNKPAVNEKGDNLDITRDENIQCEQSCSEEQKKEKCVNEKLTGHVLSKIEKSETGIAQVITIATSELKQLSSVKVVPTKLSLEPVDEKPAQTLVINITRGQNDNNSSMKSTDSSKQTSPDNGKISVSKTDNKTSDIGIIRSLLVKNKVGESATMEEIWSKKKPVVLNIVSPKLEVKNRCGKQSIRNQSSCDSLKELDLPESVCTEDSPTNVHLLSPDCRNPDSVGIVESPLPCRSNETLFLGEREESPLRSVFSLVKSDGHSVEGLVLDKTCAKKQKRDTGITLASSPIHSDSVEVMAAAGDETILDSRELTEDSRLLLTERADNSDNSGSDMLPASKSGNDIPIFRFDSDHCYAGLPGKINPVNFSAENDSNVLSEVEEPQTPLGSTSELSQDSGYEDVTQSPETEVPSRSLSEDHVENTVNQTEHSVEQAEKSVMLKTLVPVLVSVDPISGNLTVHDTNLTKTVAGQMFLPDMKLISGTNFAHMSQNPLILSPVSLGKNMSPLLTEIPKLVPAKPESIIGLISPKTVVQTAVSSDSQEMSPRKFGTFRIGTFASFSNTGMARDASIKQNPSPLKEDPVKMPSPLLRSNGVTSGKTSPPFDSLGSLVQKVKSSLSPVSHTETKMTDHIQHDHDYCTKNLMPSVVSSFLEARLLSKETPKGKVMHTRGKRADSSESGKNEKTGKRKRASSCILKEDTCDEFDVDSESDTHSIPEPLRPKYRAEKYTEPKRTDPKVKITGSSDFQDQFVYFMNTKKRSRRRESKDVPLPYGTDRVFIPPKPGDIVVPHLTDQDIENLKIRSKQTKMSPNSAGFNSLRNEFMAVKLANGTFSSQPTEPVVDDEKNIINTILSLENEDLGSPGPPESPAYNESMEMYGQGLGTDIMSLLPEQMNLTPEQIDLLYSAVYEVQNSSPGLVGAVKPVSTDTGDAAFQFPMPPFVGNKTVSENPVVTKDGKQEVQKDNLPAKDTGGTVQVEGTDKVEMATSATTNTEEVLEKVGDPVVSADQVSVGSPQVAAPGEDASAHAEPKEDLKEMSNDINKNQGNQSVSDVNLGVTEHVNSSQLASCSAPSTPVVTTTELGSNLLPVVGKAETLTISEPYGSASAGIESAKINNQLETQTGVHNEKLLFATPTLSSGISSSFSSDISSSATSVNSEISLPQLDKSLDLLGNDFKLDKPYMYPGGISGVPDSVVPDAALVTQPEVPKYLSNMEGSLIAPNLEGSLIAPVQSLPATHLVDFGAPTLPVQQSQVDYNAPWIVTVSMYWNDLPAIMINNQPYVRLVDIHKQILPAKDTGILKKRCQLMNIEVENCSEMQRYFLVQYGKAFNSKSTLIISKEHAKVLIGYYVDPQPKSSRFDDHPKSIIDHRREQLRRIALARRAAMRAQRSSEKKDEVDPREIKESSHETNLDITSQNSESEVAKLFEVPKVTSHQTHTTPVQSEGGRSQRSTRHKKINFLEMLRGDSNSHNADDDNSEELAKKMSNKIHQVNVDKNKKKQGRETKVKIVKYTVETESSEETESMESECSSEDYETESSSDSDLQVVRKPAKHLKVSSSLVAKAKSRVKAVPKTYNKGLKVKFGMKKSRPVATSTPVAIQVVNKATGTKLGSRIYRTKVTPQKGRKLLPPSNYSPPMILSNKIFENKEDILSVQEDKKSNNFNALDTDSFKNGTSAVESVGNYTSPVGVTFGQSVKFPVSDILSSSELKVSPTLPENILATSVDSECKDEEQLDIKSSESVNIQTETSLDDTENVHENSPDNVQTSENNLSGNQENDLVAPSPKQPSPKLESSSEGKLDTTHGSESSNTLESSSMVMKRKEIIQVGYDETPIRIVHRDSSPQTHQRTRSQLGEVFVERYHNKKSLCVRCYTCRKMMSVDNFLRHLHDVSGGLITINIPRTIDLGDGDLTQNEKKLWGSFLRKKELFENNQLPSSHIVQDTSLIYKVDEDAHLKVNGSLETALCDDQQEKQSGPRIITTPVSPVKKGKLIQKNKPNDKKPRIIGNIPLQTVKKLSPPAIISNDGVRTSSRKRKVKHMDGFDDYSFKKYPRLMKNAFVEDEDAS